MRLEIEPIYRQDGFWLAIVSDPSIRRTNAGEEPVLLISAPSLTWGESLREAREYCEEINRPWKIVKARHLPENRNMLRRKAGIGKLGRKKPYTIPQVKDPQHKVRRNDPK